MRRVAPWATGVIAWAAAAWLMLYSVRAGRALQRDALEVFLGAAPLVGRNFRDGWDWRFGSSLLGAAAIGVAIVVSTVRGWWWAARTRWVVASSALGAMAFSLMLALTDGRDGLLYAVTHETEYLANLPRQPNPYRFVNTFVEQINDYTVHVRGHPPGYPLLLSLLDQIGLARPWVIAIISLLATAAVPVCVLVTLRVVAGDNWVRRVAPFLVVAPYALWMTTSADALFAAFGAAGVMLLALGITRDDRRGLLLGLAGGLTLGALLFFTYLGAVFLIVPAAIAAWAARNRGVRAVKVSAAAICGGAIVTLVWLAAGFWWFDGVAATKREYWEGSAQFRVWRYFGFGNLAAALFAVGPATFAGVGRLRRWQPWLLVGAALAAMLISHVTQYTRGEVERIWLLFFPWIAIAGGALLGRQRRYPGTVWLTVQAASAIVLQAALVSKW